MESLKGKVALVTGASSGIGLETAVQLSELGMKVYGAARRLEKIEALSDKGIEAVFIDMTDEKSIEACVGKILSKEKSIDVLVNNAGYGSYGAVEDVPLDEARRQFEVNLFGLARLTQLVLPGMRENHWGKIINIASIGGHFTSPFGAWYHGTKHAVIAFSDALRLEVRGFGIKVVIIEPGLIRTPWGIIAAEGLRKHSAEGVYGKNAVAAAEYFEHRYSENPQKLTPPEKIAAAIVKAVSSKNPKVRYRLGYMAKPFVWMKQHVGDRIFDAAVIAFMKQK